MDAVAEIVCAVGALTLGADRVGMWLVDGGVARAINSDAAAVALDDESHPIAHVIRSPRARWLRSDGVPSADDRVRAACALPLIVEDRVIGAIAFTFMDEHLLLVEERDLVFEIAGAIADHAARAVARVRPRVRVPEVGCWPAGTQPYAVAPSRRILIVAEPAEATAFARALEALGHETVVVHSGAAAVRVASEWPADVAFVDVDSVITDAAGVAGKLHAPLVALTRHRARVPGFTTHVLKPFELGTVVELLDSFDRN